ncbi:MAG: AraC family transcriptional regulator [Pseudomonadota bacterium]
MRNEATNGKTMCAVARAAAAMPGRATLSPIEVMEGLPSPPTSHLTLDSSSGVTIARQRQPACELPEWTIGQHKISVVTRGGYRLEQVFNGRRRIRHKTREGDVTVMPAHSVNAWRWNASIEVVDLFVPQERLDRAARSIGKRRYELQDQFASDIPSLARVARVIALEVDRAEPDALILDGLVQTLLSVLLRDGCDDEGASGAEVRSLGPSALRRAKAFMAERADSPPKIAEIAAHLELSSTHFAMAFAADVGCPPGAYIRRLQIDRAKDMLRQDDISLSTIAMRTGFSSHSQFSRAFAREVGMPPSIYRKSSL